MPLAISEVIFYPTFSKGFQNIEILVFWCIYSYKQYLALFGSALEINSEVSQITFLSFLAEEASMEQGKISEYFKFGS